MVADGVEEQLEAALQLEDLAVVEDLLAAQDHVDDLDVFLRPLDRLLELLAVPVLDDAGARGAEADDHAAAAELVERRGGHREDRRRAAEHGRDAGAELDLLGRQGDLGEERELVAAPGLGREDGFDADFLGDLDPFDEGSVLFGRAGKSD